MVLQTLQVQAGSPASEDSPGPPSSRGLQNPAQEPLKELQKSPAGASRPPGASSRSLGGLQEPLTSFKLSGLSTYANEEVLLLTKMDLTEFRTAWGG